MSSSHQHDVKNVVKTETIHKVIRIDRRETRLPSTLTVDVRFTHHWARIVVFDKEQAGYVPITAYRSTRCDVRLSMLESEKTQFVITDTLWRRRSERDIEEAYNRRKDAKSLHKAYLKAHNDSIDYLVNHVVTDAVVMFVAFFTTAAEQLRAAINKAAGEDLFAATPPDLVPASRGKMLKLVVALRHWLAAAPDAVAARKLCAGLTAAFHAIVRATPVRWALVKLIKGKLWAALVPRRADMINQSLARLVEVIAPAALAEPKKSTETKDKPCQAKRGRPKKPVPPHMLKLHQHIQQVLWLGPREGMSLGAVAIELQRRGLKSSYAQPAKEVRDAARHAAFKHMYKLVKSDNGANRIQLTPAGRRAHLANVASTPAAVAAVPAGPRATVATAAN